MRNIKRVDSFMYYAFVVVYALIFVFGLVENIAIIYTSIKNKILNTARNLFIVNLAVSNLLLCMFTMPLALTDLIHTYWPINDDYACLCRLTSSSQSAAVFFSSFSVMVIALDRMIVITYRAEYQISCQMAVIISII